MNINDMKILPFLQAMVSYEASDLYLTTGAFASVKIMGKYHQLSEEKLMPGTISEFGRELTSDIEWNEFQVQKEFNKALSLRNIGRFRLNMYFQRGEVSMVIRHIRSEIKPPDELGLPEILQDLIMDKEGLILFVGSTGSGKSTSMASLIQYRNERVCGHILTIEDPIEFAFRHSKSIIGQREVGFDTHSYSNAMREAMREAPDVIMVGEVRDTSTMEAVIGFADTGHLVISTLHATNTVQALERMLYLFPHEQKTRILMDLSLNLKGIVAQRLIPSVQDSYVLATEVLINTPYVAETIRKGHFNDLKDIITKGTVDGMHSFDQSILKHYISGMVSKDMALQYAGSKNNLEWEMNFHQENGETSQVKNKEEEEAMKSESLPELSF